MKTLVAKELVDLKYISMKLTLTSPQGSNPRVPLVAGRPTQGNGRASPSLQTRYSYPGPSVFLTVNLSGCHHYKNNNKKQTKNKQTKQTNVILKV